MSPFVPQSRAQKAR